MNSKGYDKGRAETEMQTDVRRKFFLMRCSWFSQVR